ncbi:MAG: hypothetical protein U0031_00175 [Thermomicrobiales bacterium]
MLRWVLLMTVLLLAPPLGAEAVRRGATAPTATAVTPVDVRVMTFTVWLGGVQVELGASSRPSAP